MVTPYERVATICGRSRGINAPAVSPIRPASAADSMAARVIARNATSWPGCSVGCTAAKKAVADSRTSTQWETVVEGRYAIPTEEGAINELAFYKVDRPTEGRWAGYVFVKRLVGPEEQRLSQKQSAAILAKIGEFGAEKASKLYGKEIGHCGVCGRRLTNDESREAGIGPICAQGLGW